MTGFEPRTSGIGSDRSTNWATTTAQPTDLFEREKPPQHKHGDWVDEKLDFRPEGVESEGWGHGSKIPQKLSSHCVKWGGQEGWQWDPTDSSTVQRIQNVSANFLDDHQRSGKSTGKQIFGNAAPSLMGQLQLQQDELCQDFAPGLWCSDKWRH